MRKDAPPTQLIRARRENWEGADTHLVDRAPPPSLETQMNALLGGQTFREQTFYAVQRPMRSMRPWRKRRLALATLALGMVAAAITTAVVIARDVSRSRECAALVHELEAFLRTGELRQADEMLERVRVLAEATGRSRDLAPLMARSEATLFRYVEASPERKASVESLLAIAGEGTFDAVVARALITPPTELGEMQAVLQTIATRTGDPEAAFLAAVSLAHSGQRERADRAFVRSIDLEPTNLPHLAFYACWLARTDRMKEAEDTVDQMRNVAPESPWIEWVGVEMENSKALTPETPEAPAKSVRNTRNTKLARRDHSTKSGGRARGGRRR